jgi:hypothetical protein
VADITIPPTAVIDDFEDGDLFLPSPARQGRVGNWYAYGDGTGVTSLDPLAINRGVSSAKGVHAKGAVFTNWGSGFGVDLNYNQSTKAPYDASAYKGITFWARAESTPTVTVLLPDTDTDAVGGTCSSCGHHFYKAVQLTTGWQRFTIAFAQLAPEPGGFPQPTAFKPSGVFTIQFRLAAGQNYDVYVDDVAFVN